MDAGSGDSADADPGFFRRATRAWRQWRRTRPFWGGLLVLVAGLEILLSERAPLPIIVHIGLQGIAGYIVPTVVVLLGLLLLFNPAQRTFYSLLAVLLALGSWITSDLGGFFVGMLLCVLGGSLAFAWQLRDEPEEPSRRRRPPPQQTRSAGLALIRSDPPADDGAAADGTPPDGPPPNPPLGLTAVRLRTAPDGPMDNSTSDRLAVGDEGLDTPRPTA